MEKKIRKKKEPYRASQSLIAASFDSSYDTRKDEMGARSQEGNWQENDRKIMRERGKNGEMERECVDLPFGG